MIGKLHGTFCIVILSVILVSCGPSKEQLSTQTAIAATATFEALPTVTPTRTFTAIPTSTLTSTKTPIPTMTETVTPTNFPENWKDAFFIPIEKEQELRDKGAIILTDLPVEEWKDLQVTRPGQVYVVCDGRGAKNLIPKTSYLTRIATDRMHYGNKVCLIQAASKQEIIDKYKKKAPLASSEKILQLTNKFIELSKAMYSQIPDGPYYLDTYYALSLWVDPEYLDYLKWMLFGISSEDNSVTTYIKDIPIDELIK